MLIVETGAVFASTALARIAAKILFGLPEAQRREIFMSAAKCKKIVAQSRKQLPTNAKIALAYRLQGPECKSKELRPDKKLRINNLRIAQKKVFLLTKN